MKRTTIMTGAKSAERGSTFAKRGGRLKRGRLDRTAVLLHRQDVRIRDRIADKRAWGERAARSRCVMCGTGWHVTGHHIIPLRILKAHSVDPALWYDRRNLLPLCMEPSPGRCHQRHELWVVRVPREALPAAVYEFAEEVGLGWVLDREYAT